MRRPILFYTVTLLCGLTALGFMAAVACQQMLRRGANEPQRQMVESGAAKMATGAGLENVIPESRVELSDSLEPFLAFYDADGKPVRSTGYLGSAPPAPPAGVFEYLRRNGFELITLQPRAGVRLATVARRIDGPRPGFLIAGRSLRVVEEYEGELRYMVFAGWAFVVALLTGGAFFLSRSMRQAAAAH